MLSWRSISGSLAAVALAATAVALAVVPAASAASAGATGTTGATGATGSTGATGATNPAMSSNWAGYAVSGEGSVTRHFKHVTASWIEPTATCTQGSATYSAFWVGLGGVSQSARKLEQAGTEADCDSDGQAHYSAWYELVPAGPVTTKLTIAPGDRISTSVTVRGAYVTMSLIDDTTGARVLKRLHFPHADTTSAEWIAEAPSDCAGSSCRALPLTDFGSVNFTDASTRIANGHTGTITDPAWATQAIALDEPTRPGSGERVFGPPELVSATPSVLEATGSSFSVSWTAAPLNVSPGGRVFPGLRD
jgi:hypothetical protein